jgi:hypothetical protein
MGAGPRIGPAQRMRAIRPQLEGIALKVR